LHQVGLNKSFQCSLSKTFLQQMAIIMQPVENCCITKSSGWSTWARVTKWEVIVMGRDGLCGLCGEKAPAWNTAFVGYGTSTVARKLHRWLSM